MLRIVIAIAALLVYGSLYPWRFHAQHGAVGPVETLLHSWEFSLNRFALRDIAINIAIYIPFGAAAYLWLSRRTAPIRIVAPAALAALLSTCIELAQFYDSHRFTSAIDVVTNIAGAALGSALASTATARGNARAAIRIQHPGAVLLLGCFVGSLLFPLIPDFSRTHLAEKFAGFLETPFVPVPGFAMFVGWLVAARILSVLLGPASKHKIFPLLSLLLPARFLVLGLNAGWEYWAALLAAWLVWIFLPNSSRSDTVLGCLALLSIVASGLAPFSLAHPPHRFVWVPFRAVFSTAWEIGFAILLRKAFLYGSAVWLFHESGLRLRNAAILVALLLAAIEGAQIYIPDHAPEITDPLLCLMMAWLLHRLARAWVRHA